MTTDIWFRDPLDYIEECSTLLVPKIVWEGRILDQKAIDAQAQIELHYPTTFDYRILVVREDGTVELRRGYSPTMPAAVYQTWSYDEDDLDDLEDMLQNHPGEDIALCTDPSIPVDRRPVFGQEHRVMITRWPDARTTLGRAFLRALARYQKDFPEVIIHLWGTNSYRALFGMGLAAGDFDPSIDAKYKVIFLPSGRRTVVDKAQVFAQWIRLLGFTQNELRKPAGRVLFNIKSAQWAAEYFETDLSFKSTGYDPVDINAHHHLPATTPKIMTRNLKVGDGDKITCDTCSLFATCKYYREEAVCSLPDTESAKLAAFFATRSSDVIIEGLGKVIAAQATRFQRGLEDEQYSEDGIDPNVTRLGHVIVNDGVQLAKLVDPRLAAAGAARITAFLGGQHIHNGTTNSLVADIVKELEEQGRAREDITPEMINEYIVQQQQTQAIEASSRE
jgi:hypothetical protein